MIGLHRVGAIMRTTNRLAMIMCSAALLAACSAQDPAPQEAIPVEETAFDDVVGTMDKARAVEDTSRQRMDQLNDALENSETR